MKVSLRLFVLDDHPVARQGLVSVLELDSDIDIVGTASSLTDVDTRINAAGPSVVLADLLVGDRRGTELVPMLAEHANGTPPPPVLIFSSVEDPATALDALERGAAGYVVKTASMETLRDAIHTVADGNVFIDPTLAAEMIGLRVNGAARERDLSKREQELLRLMSTGMTNKQIGAELYLSEKTVKNYLTGAFRKIGVRNRTEAALWARDHLA